MNKFFKTTLILLLWLFLSAAIVRADSVVNRDTHTLSAQLEINSNTFRDSYIHGCRLPDEDWFNELPIGGQGIRPKESAVLTVKELLGSAQCMVEWKENIRLYDGKIFYWVHPLFMENNLERYYNGFRFSNIYRKLSADKLGLSEEQISRSIVRAEYRHFLQQITDYVKKYPGPVFVAVGGSYIEQVRDFLVAHKIKAVLIPTADRDPTPEGLDALNLDIGDAYGYEDWRYLHAILQDELGVREVAIVGEICQEQVKLFETGCVLGTKNGFFNALKFSRSNKEFKVGINYNFVFPDSLYYSNTKIGSTGFSVFKSISLVESAI